jgi:hypothetical protein
MYMQEEVTITILGDENTFSVLQPLLERASLQRVVADEDEDDEEGTWSARKVLKSMLKAAPPEGPWMVVFDFSLLDSDLDDRGVSPEVEKIKRERYRRLLEFFTVLNDINLEIANLHPKVCVLPDRIVPIHIGRDALVRIFEVIKEAIQAVKAQHDRE